MFITQLQAGGSTCHSSTSNSHIEVPFIGIASGTDLVAQTRLMLVNWACMAQQPVYSLTQLWGASVVVPSAHKIVKIIRPVLHKTLPQKHPYHHYD